MSTRDYVAFRLWVRYSTINITNPNNGPVKDANSSLLLNIVLKSEQHQFLTN